jgi:dUTP pyrophosphatase
MNHWPIPVQYLNTLEGQPALPTRAYPDDAGYDLYVSETTEVPPGAFVDIPTGVAMQLPDWSWGMLTGRSSTLRKRGLLVNTGIIDTGYRGELYAGVFNLTKETVVVEVGERIAQIIILTNATRLTSVVPLLEGETLEPHSRGNNGFGSSGR